MLENTLIYLFISIGCSCLWSLSDIFTPIRNFVAKNLKGFFQKMLLCMECSSFWIGLFVASIFPPFNYLIIDNFYLNKLVICIIGGIITYLFVKILNKKQLL
jgi:hypothetical protein